jgi:uncharacterized delta-60 repeat protein
LVALALLGPVPVRAIPPGALDPTFGDGVHSGWVQIPVAQGGKGSGVLTDPQGRVLVGSIDAEAGVVYVVVRRFLPGGALDASFGSGGRVTVSVPAENTDVHLALAENGDLFVGTTEPVDQISSNFRIDRFTSGGASSGNAVVDFGYGANSSEQLYALTVAAGRVLTVGRAAWAATDTDFAVAVLDATTLELDSSFAGTGRLVVPFDLGGGNQDEGHALVARSDGRILIAGAADTASGFRAALLRLLPDGSLDPSFGSGGRATYTFTPPPGTSPMTGAFLDLLTDPDGTVWAAGIVSPPEPDRNLDFALARILESGVIDASWATGGWAVVGFTYPGGTTATQDVAFTVARDAAGRLLLAGRNSVPSLYRYAAGAVRLLPDGALDTRFGTTGDGRAQHVLTATSRTQPFGATFDSNDRLVLAGEVLEPGAPVYDVFVARLTGDLVFRDGFDSGNTSAWSAAFP